MSRYNHSLVRALCALTISWPITIFSAVQAIEGDLTYHSRGDSAKAREALVALAKKNPRIKVSDNMLTNLFTPLKRHFRVEIDDANRWKIRSIQLERPELPESITQTDGTNLLAYSVPKIGETNLHVLSLDEGPIPRERGAEAHNVLWLTFASGFFFKTNLSETINWFLTRNASNQVVSASVPAVVTVSDIFPFPPTSAMLGWRQTQLKGDSVARFGEGAELLSRDFTNSGGFLIPLTAQYTRWASVDGLTNETMLTVSIVVTNTKVSGSFQTGSIDGGSDAHVPKQIDLSLPPRILVADRRSPGPPATYLAKGGEVPKKDSPQVLAAKTRAIEQAAARQKRTSPPKQGLVPFAIGLSILLLPLLLIFRRMKTEK